MASYNRTEEHRRKMSERFKGRKFTEEHCQKISKAAKARKRQPHSEETKRKISLAHKGKPKSEEHLRKIGDALRGRVVPESQKQILRERNSGSGNPFFGRKHTQEAKDKIREAHKGKTCSKETIERFKLANSGPNNGMYGKKHSDESKRKISEGRLAKGYTPWNKDKTGVYSEARLKSMSDFMTGRCVGEKSPNWTGGDRQYGPEFNGRLKENIRDRDNRVCQFCGLPEDENVRLLPVHHIDYNKRKNNPNNLIALCDYCHGKTQKDRPQWANYFKIYQQGRQLKQLQSDLLVA